MVNITSGASPLVKYEPFIEFIILTWFINFNVSICFYEEKKYNIIQIWSNIYTLTTINIYYLVCQLHLRCLQDLDGVHEIG